MKTTAEIGLKITAAQREFCRYTGISAAIERRGLGASRIENAWATRSRVSPDERPADDSSRPASRAVR